MLKPTDSLRRGLTLMDDKFTTYATAEIMIDNISYSDAEALCGKLKNIKDVKEITFDDTSDHYATAAALF